MHTKAHVGKVPLSVPNITAEDRKAVVQALASRWLTGGPRSIAFERMFAEYVGTRFAVATNSCTAALHLSLRALGIGPGDEVIVPVLTFAATANAALFCGARPVFADVGEDCFGISVQEVQDRISSHTKAIIPVHYAGQPCNIGELVEITSERGIRVVEDCAHSLGAVCDGKQTGSFGVAGCFSFYPTKNITTLEGGMLTTNDQELARKARQLREHGIDKTALDRESQASWRYDVLDLGYNYRLSDVQAALGMSQLRRIDRMNADRIKQARYLTSRLSRIKGIIPPSEVKGRKHLYHLYVIRVLSEQLGISRDKLFDEMTKRGIGLSVHYTPLHLLSFYRKTLGVGPGDFPVAERIYGEILSLPMFSGIKRTQIDAVVQAIDQARD